LITTNLFSQSVPSAHEHDSMLPYKSTCIPINENKILIYDSDFGETVSKVVKNGDKFEIINESEKFKYIQKLKKEDDGLYLFQTNQYVDVFLFISSSAEIHYTSPALNIALPLEEKKKWTWSGEQFDDDSTETKSVSINGEVVGIEKINVPAGEFEAVKISIKISIENGSNSDVTQWLVPDIGVVKTVAKVEGTGLVGMLTSLLGYDELVFELKEIREIEN